MQLFAEDAAFGVPGRPLCVPEDASQVGNPACGQDVPYLPGVNGYRGSGHPRLSGIGI